MPRILVLDDEPMIAMMLEEWLTDLDCEIVGPAYSLSAALELLEHETPDGAILDVSLRNNENCYPVAKALLERGIPFALATGHDAVDLDPRYVPELMLSKPFDYASVKAVVMKLIEAQPRKPHNVK
jgi:CheY-like chemotaxis protein